MGAVESGGAPPLIGGDSPEAVAVCAALEQCLFHRIRVKEFGEAVKRRFFPPGVVQVSPPWVSLPDRISRVMPVLIVNRSLHVAVVSRVERKPHGFLRGSIQFRNDRTCRLLLFGLVVVRP